MNTDIELEAWREQWQADPVVPPNLRRNVERQSRLMKIGLIADTLVTVVMGGGTTLWALRFPGTDLGQVAAATWFFLAAAWLFAFITKRGLWAPSAIDTASFVDLSIRRCRASLAATWFGAGLFVSEVAFGLGWVYKHSIQAPQPLWRWLLFSSLRIDIVWICTLAFFSAIVWYRRKKKVELTRLLTLRSEMAAQTADGSDRQESQSAWDGWPLGRRARRSRAGKDKRQI
jgi:hypothetical protein